MLCDAGPRRAESHGLMTVLPQRERAALTSFTWMCHAADMYTNMWHVSRRWEL